MRKVISLVLVFAMTLTHVACMTPPRPIASPRTYIPLRRPERVWLTDQEGERYVVMRPRALGDTLFGRTPNGEEVWIAFRDTRRIEARQMDRAKTYAVIGGSIVAAVVIFALASATGTSIPPEQIPTEEPHILRR